jgi:hypothetical protein
MWVIAIVTIVGATSANPSPQFGVGGWGHASREECEGALLQRQSESVTLTKNNHGEFVLYGQERGYVWTEGCIWIPN